MFWKTVVLFFWKRAIMFEILFHRRSSILLLRLICKSGVTSLWDVVIVPSQKNNIAWFWMGKLLPFKTSKILLLRENKILLFQQSSTGTSSCYCL